MIALKRLRLEALEEQIDNCTLLLDERDRSVVFPPIHKIRPQTVISTLERLQNMTEKSGEREITRLKHILNRPLISIIQFQNRC
ncbi:hypothetical protein KIN20_023715 [Parelaphostrongylus tenuis]|uniref:Uncharacterized protein n=1 Tax=Parelaphostrongylus tenuis TaxID=148309 RepID=A0AAD5MS59_PARTN|nr:hypothetical protein KIN20_023715 [Parelaphostrongylus tenuis]